MIKLVVRIFDKFYCLNLESIRIFVFIVFKDLKRRLRLNILNFGIMLL